MLVNNIKKLIGIDEPLSLENKLFNAVCLAVFISMISALISNVLLGFPVGLLLIELFLGIISCWAFYISRYKGFNEKVAIVYISIGILLFIPAWFLNGGIEGSTTQIGVFFIVLIMTLLKRKYHFFFYRSPDVCFLCLLFFGKTVSGTSCTYCKY